ncbi:hypothetical protein DFS34DRAFT_225778 [Phlyctochytrium arcticum]|nr:hypothetical protein DFS34DRAFT_225778 [Phlyctochytrium arcticum]
MTGSPRLPTELLVKIASEIKDRQVLLALSTVSHVWKQVAEPLLYRSLHFWDSEHLPKTLQLLSQLLESKPQLASLVTELRFIKYGEDEGVDPNVPKLASLCPNLTRLNLSYCETLEDQELLNIVRNCKSLEELSIEDCWEITSQGLGLMLPFLKNLRRLNVATVHLDDDCFRNIAKTCPLLEDLDLSSTDITRAGVSSIMELATSLRSLNLWECSKITSSELEAIMNEKPPHVKIPPYLPYDTKYQHDDDFFEWDDDSS